MIELNDKTQQEFLNREWVQKLLDAGVDMSDAHYYLQDTLMGDLYIIEKDSADNWKKHGMGDRVLPTYSMSELLNKIHECLVDYTKHDKIGVIEIFQYCSYASIIDEDNFRNPIKHTSNNGSYIESLAELLIKCYKENKINII